MVIKKRRLFLVLLIIVLVLEIIVALNIYEIIDISKII